MPDDIQPATLSSAEGLDEDELKLDPLEEGMDPPEHWKQADKFGNTAFEERQGQDLDHRLLEEQPDILPDEQRRQSLEDTPVDQLDDTIDDESYDVERVGPDDSPVDSPSPAAQNGLSAEEAGGSVAEEIRTPPDAT